MTPMIPKKQDGSMIFEVLVAVILTGASLFSMSKFSQYLTKQTTLSSQVSMATQIARQVMQNSRRASNATPPVAPTTTAAAPVTKQILGFTPLNTAYFQAQTVAAVPGLPTINLVTIAISWNDADGVPQVVKLSSYF